VAIASVADSETGYDNVIADSHTAAQSEWLERAGGGGQARSSGFFLQLAILTESAGEPWRRYHTFDIFITPHWGWQ
jgi:hypothetical protein